MAKKRLPPKLGREDSERTSGWERNFKTVFEDFLSNFIRALLLFILFTVLRLVAEGFMGNVTTMDDRHPYYPEDEKVPVKLSYKLAVAHRDAGLIGQSLDYFDVVILQVKNSTLARDQLLFSESLLNKGALLLAYVAKVARLDPRGDLLRYDTVGAVRETVGIAQWVDGDLKISGRDGEIGVMRALHESYAYHHPSRLVEEAIYTLSKAAKLGTTRKDKGTDLSVNLGLAVLVSQALSHESSSADVIKDVHQSFEKLASEDPTITPLVAMLNTILASDGDLPMTIHKELFRNGFLGMIRGLGGFLKTIEKKHDPEWEAISALDDPAAHLLDLDQCTVHTDLTNGVKVASKQRESFHHWLPQSSHLNQISILATDVHEGENADVIFVGRKRYFIESRSSHRLRGLYTYKEVPMEVPYTGDSPGAPHEALELARDWRTRR